MLLATMGYLPPVASAVLQVIIVFVAVINALRMSIPTARLTAFSRAKLVINFVFCVVDLDDVRRQASGTH
jgi:hypothetical protein